MIAPKPAMKKFDPITIWKKTQSWFRQKMAQVIKSVRSEKVLLKRKNTTITCIITRVAKNPNQGLGLTQLGKTLKKLGLRI